MLLDCDWLIPVQLNPKNSKCIFNFNKFKINLL